jgi:hypothetical protein
MKSGWFFGTELWQAYLLEYSKTRPECLYEWKSSPLDLDGHDFSERKMNATYCQTEHLSQVIDLRTHKWSDVRKSYRSIIHRGQEQLEILEEEDILVFKSVHQCAFGSVRSISTYEIQNYWIKSGNAMAVSARNKKDEFVAAALWIIYKGCAYYASAPSLRKNTMHAVIWKSLHLLQARGVTLVELGQIDGETEKEKGIARFKSGWGGLTMPFTIVREVGK